MRCDRDDTREERAIKDAHALYDLMEETYNSRYHELNSTQVNQLVDAMSDLDSAAEKFAAATRDLRPGVV